MIYYKFIITYEISRFMQKMMVEGFQLRIT